MSEAASPAAASLAGAAASSTGGLLQVEVVSPGGRVLVGTCATLVAPAIHGEIGILPGHAPYLSGLAIGVVRLSGFSASGPGAADAPSGEVRVFVAGGFIEVLDDRVVVLAETAERGDRVDAERAETARRRAVDRLAAVDQPSSVVDRVRARRAAVRAVARLKAAGSTLGAPSTHV